MPFYADNTRNLLAIAKQAAEESKQYLPGAIISIIFAAIGVESFVNDFIRNVFISHPDSLIPEFVALKEIAAAADIEDKNTPLFRKIDVISVALTKMRGDFGRQPFQDLNLLLDLRNAIVHSRPEQLQVVEKISPEGVHTHLQPEAAPLVSKLAERGVLQTPPAEVLTSLLAVLHHPRVAVWAYNTAVETIKHLIDLIPSPGWREIFSTKTQTDSLEMPPL